MSAARLPDVLISAAEAALAAGELLVVVGPTASGKTAMAVSLAERFAGEIVSADSVQIYRGFDVGSGKPSPDEARRARHHLVSVAEPLDAWDAARFAGEASAALAAIAGRGRVPIVCGGTFLWVKSLVHGLAPAPPADAGVRREHERIAATAGREALHERLRQVDPPSAERLAPRDFVRVSRALEVYELTGRPLSAWHAEHGFRERQHRAWLCGVAQERAELDRRIAARVTRWLDAGWLDEVAALLPDYRDARAMSSVGYRQVRDHVDGALARDDLATAIVRATRVFARRQRTWLRDQPVHWFSD